MPQVPAIQEVRASLDRMEPQFRAALPSHISPAKFQRVAITAIQQNPDLLTVNRQSLYGACIQAAQQGLLPDGREGAIVKFGQAATFMPMVAGVLKKIRNSGELASIAAHCVYENDAFEYVLGDDERVVHKPVLSGRGNMIAVYAIARLKDGTVVREIMSKEEVDTIRNASRSKDSGPWKQWYSEMARKSVIRRLAKYLPQSTDKDGADPIEAVLDADRQFYEDGPVVEADATEAEQPRRGRPPGSRNAKLQAVVDHAPVEQPAPVEPETSEVFDPQTGEFEEEAF